MKELIDQLINDEGLCLMPYKCPAGKLTIGVGRNIEDNGITKEEARGLLKNDIERVKKELRDNVKVFEKFNIPRQRALINMCFNLGLGRFLKFKKMLAALESEDFDAASAEMLDSRWARQVGKRADRIANTMKYGI